MFRLACEDRTGFVCLIADGDNIIEWHIRQFIDVLGMVPADVHARFGHDLDGPSVHAMRLDAGGVRFDLVDLQLLRPAFSHLASAGIARAEK